MFFNQSPPFLDMFSNKLSKKNCVYHFLISATDTCKRFSFYIHKVQIKKNKNLKFDYKKSIAYKRNWYTQI